MVKKAEQRVIKPPFSPLFDTNERDTWRRAANDEQRAARERAIMETVLNAAGVSADGYKRLELLERGAKIYRILNEYLYSFAVALALELEERTAAQP